MREKERFGALAEKIKNIALGLKMVEPKAIKARTHTPLYFFEIFICIMYLAPYPLTHSP